MQPIDEEELKVIIEETRKAKKDTSELEKILAEKRFVKPTLGEIKKKDQEMMLWRQTDEGAVREKAKGKSVILSTGPAREDDFV
jgi:hypothetical protein